MDASKMDCSDVYSLIQVDKFKKDTIINQDSHSLFVVEDIDEVI